MLKKTIFITVLAVLAFYACMSAVLFWWNPDIPEITDPAELKTSDIVVVFSGATERIEPAFNLAARQIARTIVVSRADESQMKSWSAAYAKGFHAYYILESKATSTHENAYYCAEIIKRTGAKKIILITSYYHMARSRRLLALALRGYPCEAVGYPVYPHGITNTKALEEIPYFRALTRIEKTNIAFNYLKFLVNGCRISKCSGIEHRLEKLYGNWVKQKLAEYDLSRMKDSLPGRSVRE